MGTGALLFTVVFALLSAESGAKLSWEDEELLVAADSGDLMKARMALTAGKADANVQTETGETPLIFACLRGHTSIVKLLLEKGADVDYQNEQSNGATALMAAAYKGQEKVALALIQGGANVESVEADGTTALMTASVMGSSGVVKLLLDSGASIDAEANDGASAMSLAAKNGRAEVVDLLQQAIGERALKQARMARDGVQGDEQEL